MPRIEDIPEDDRPRERMASVGVENISSQELLALVIEKGRRGKNALQLAQELLSEFDSLTAVRTASLEELQSTSGIGEATACKIKAAFYLGVQSSQESSDPGQRLTSAQAIHDFLSNKIGHKKQEHFYLLTLSTRNHLLSADQMFVGTLDKGTVHPREIYQKAVLQSAAQIAVAHNHPSGDPHPSQSDRELTHRINKIGNLFGIDLFDHAIITTDDYYSFAENGII